MTRPPAGSRTGAAAQGIRPVARLDIPGGGQVTVEGGLCFVGHMRPPHGTTIIDVRDPARPRVLCTIPPPDAHSHSHKVRVAGNIMITNVERDRRHFHRKGEALARTEAELGAALGRAPSAAEISARLGIDPADLPELRAGLARGYGSGGFRVWDISDPAAPQLLTHMHTGGNGVHRFDMDDRHAYISTEMEGFCGNILVIYDISDPARPREVSRWWMEGQHLAGGERPHWPGRSHRLHHALRCGDTLWAACWQAGIRVIDIADITAPRTIGRYNYHPPFPEPTHTAFLLPDPIGGRRIALAIDEEHEHTPGQPHAFLWVLDASDPADLRPLSTFHVGEADSPFSRAGGRFGAHQFAERACGSLVHAAWFAGGLRVIDIADPLLPREVASFIPEPFPGQSAPQSNDVDIDERGLIYLLDRNRGLDILERD